MAIALIGELYSHNQSPRVINVDKNAAYPKTTDTLKADDTLPETTELRQNKYLNQQVEQDHRFIKRLVNPGMGFVTVNTARRTLRGFEAMNMIRFGQVQGVARGAGQTHLVNKNGLFSITSDFFALSAIY